MKRGEVTFDDSSIASLVILITSAPFGWLVGAFIEEDTEEGHQGRAPRTEYKGKTVEGRKEGERGKEEREKGRKGGRSRNEGRQREMKR